MCMRQHSAPRSATSAAMPASPRNAVTSLTSAHPPSENESGVTLTTPMTWKSPAMGVILAGLHAQAQPQAGQLHAREGGPGPWGAQDGEEQRRRVHVRLALDRHSVTERDAVA